MKLPLLLLSTLLLLTGCDFPDHSAQAATGNPTSTSSATNSVIATVPIEPLLVAPTNSVKPPPMPPGLPEAAQEVVTLALSQIGDGVLTNFIANLKEPFQLEADQIVYLRDVGLSPGVIEALLTRQQQIDTEIRGQAINTGIRTPVFLPATNTIPADSGSEPTPYPGSIPEMSPPQVGPAQTVAAPGPEPQPEVTNNYNFFYDSLAPYGNWVTVPSYGYVWQPACSVISPGWRPYWDNGSWVWSDSGWYWNSYYSWGWAPFHYGNWFNSPGYGWCWAPGRVWGPSWVTFRYSSGYCGWAPLPPGCGWQSGVGLTFSGGGVGVSFGFGYGAANYCWTPTSYFAAPFCANYGVHGRQAVQIFNNSTVINNYVVGNNNTIINGGIDPGQVQRHSRSEIRKVQLADSSSPTASLGRPGQSGRMEVYRPTISSGSSAAPSVRPSRAEVRPGHLASQSGTVPSRNRLTSRSGTPPGTTPSRIDIPAGSPSPLGSPVRLTGRPSSGGNPAGSQSAIGSTPRTSPNMSSRQTAAQYNGQTLTPGVSTTIPGRVEPRKTTVGQPAPGQQQRATTGSSTMRPSPRSSSASAPPQNAQAPARIPPGTSSRFAVRSPSASSMINPARSPSGPSRPTPTYSGSAGFNSPSRSYSTPASASISRPSPGGGSSLRPRQAP